MKKRLISLFLVLCMVVGFIPAASAAAPTEAEAYAAMMALQDEYYEGRPWTNDNFYQWNGGIFSGGYGCAGFAFILSDAAFGTLPARQVYDITIGDVRVGDILRINSNTHSVIVLEVRSDHVVIAEGNYNSSIHWGRTLTADQVAAADYLMTRYPTNSETLYNITVPTAEHCTVQLSHTKATRGTTVTATVTPDSQYYVTYHGIGVGPDGIIPDVTRDDYPSYSVFTFTMPSNDVQLSFYTEKSTVYYSLSARTFMGVGTASFEPSIVAAGDEVTVTVTPGEGYCFDSYGLSNSIGEAAQDSIFGQWKTTPEGGTYTFIMPELTDGVGYLQVDFFFAEDENVTPTISVGENISVNLAAGEKSVYEFTPDADGTYVLWYPAQYVRNGSLIFDSTAMFVADGVHYPGIEQVHNGASMCYMAYQLRAGVTYELRVFNNGGTGVSYSMLFDKAGPADSVKLDMSAYATDDIGSYQYIYAEPGKPYQTLEDVTWSTDDPSVVTIGVDVAGNGKYIWMNGEGVATVTATLPNGASASCVVRVGVDNPFADVSSSDYFFGPVLWAYHQGITVGTTASTFGPEELCTRAQVVTFLWRAMGQPAPTQTANPFTDVKSGDWFYDAVLWAVEEGITVGTSDTTFSPEETCTRAQVATFLYRAADEPSHSMTSNPFTDLAEDWYVDSVLWALEQGITKGDGSAETFNPEGKCTRGQIVTFLYRYAH